jgi:alanine dehydrogenase
MILGVPKEIKDNEYRVSMVPAGVKSLTDAGHRVLVEKGAGQGSGVSDEEFVRAGGTLVESAATLFADAEMVVKVKEPQKDEVARLRRGQILFTYLHLAPDAELTRGLLNAGVAGMAYETIEETDGSLPLLTPMSEVAGRMSIQVGTHYLQRTQGGVGILLGGVPGVLPGQVVIIGGGTVGTNAAKLALGLGARVTVLERSAARMRYLDDIFGGRVETLMSNAYYLAESVARADLLIGAVLIAGASAPKLVKRSMIASMKRGSVIVDVAVDQGGCIETTHATTHSEPIFVVDEVVHYCVANMPGAVPRTSTYALTNVTLPYIFRIAQAGLKGALRKDPPLALGLNVFEGKVVHPAVAASQGLPHSTLESILA